MRVGRARHVIVLDRDGTIVVDRHYLNDPAGLEFLPGAAGGLRALHRQGCRLVILTNQSGVGRGLVSLEQLNSIHDRLARMMEEAGAPVAGIYFCPHTPDAACNCRKPATGLLTRAAADLGFEMSSVVVIGDKESDIELGRRVAAPTFLIASDATAAGVSQADFVVPDLQAAARVITSTLD